MDSRVCNTSQFLDWQNPFFWGMNYFLSGNKHTHCKKKDMNYLQVESLLHFHLWNKIRHVKIYLALAQCLRLSSPLIIHQTTSRSIAVEHTGEILHAPGSSGNGYGWMKLFKSNRWEQRQESTMDSVKWDLGKPGENIGMRSQSCSVFVWFHFLVWVGFFSLLLVVFVFLGSCWKKTQ